jgi:hypothetical protein
MAHLRNLYFTDARAGDPTLSLGWPTARCGIPTTDRDCIAWSQMTAACVDVLDDEGISVQWGNQSCKERSAVD